MGRDPVEGQDVDLSWLELGIGRWAENQPKSGPYEPHGLRFLDQASGRMMLLVTGGHWLGWLCFRHPDGQWVTLRQATEDDRRAIYAAVEKTMVELPPGGPAASPRK